MVERNVALYLNLGQLGGGAVVVVVASAGVDGGYSVNGRVPEGKKKLKQSVSVGRTGRSGGGL